MLTARIYHEETDVDQRLKPFGVTRQELFSIVQGVVAARADVIDDDPVTAAGQFAYIYGTRLLRQLFTPKRWLRTRENNVESVRHPERNLKIVYQSVDMASHELREPKAVSGKGSGTDRMIDAAQGSLFNIADLEKLNPVTIQPVDQGLWFFCVSVSGDDVRAELSLPAAIEGGNFDRFIERIFILRGGEWEPTSKISVDNDDAIEFQPTITRRR